MKIQPTCIFSYRKGIKNNEFKCEFIYRRMFFDILPCIRLDKSPFFPSLHISFTFLNFHLLFAFSKEVGEDFEPKIKEYHPKKICGGIMYNGCTFSSIGLSLYTWPRPFQKGITIELFNFFVNIKKRGCCDKRTNFG